jgi:glycosyltransferase involved in cell wall biosynthesis
VKERGLADRVRFYGVIADPSQLAEMYAQHDIFCLPTYYPEGFPRALYEAMTFSLPSITTRVGQIESVIRDDENALFVKIRDADDLAAKIVRLANNRELRERLGRRARTTMEPLLGKWRESTHGHQVLRWMQASGVAPCAE